VFWGALAAGGELVGELVGVVVVPLFALLAVPQPTDARIISVRRKRHRAGCGPAFLDSFMAVCPG